MSKDIKFTLTDAQLAAMDLLGYEDASATINAAVQTKLISALVYNRKKAEDEAFENYKRISGYLVAQKMTMPQSFGDFKANTLATFQNALDELGYTPNKKKTAQEESEEAAQ